MTIGKRVAALESSIITEPAATEPFDWEQYGEIGLLTLRCISEFLTRGNPLDNHGHQLMRVGGFALSKLIGGPVSEYEVESLHHLMTKNSGHMPYGYSEVKHPLALELFELLCQEGHL